MRCGDDAHMSSYQVDALLETWKFLAARFFNHLDASYAEVRALCLILSHTRSLANALVSGVLDDPLARDVAPAALRRERHQDGAARARSRVLPELHILSTWLCGSVSLYVICRSSVLNYVVCPIDARLSASAREQTQRDALEHRRRHDDRLVEPLVHPAVHPAARDRRVLPGASLTTYKNVTEALTPPHWP